MLHEFKCFISCIIVQKTKKVISGYKIKYTNVDNGVIVEISMYDDENKELIIQEQLQKARIPYFIVYAMLILKYLLINIVSYQKIHLDG